MSPVKKQAIDVIQSLPDDCTLEDIHYHLYVREKVERGMKAADAGRVVSQKEAEKKVRGWLKGTSKNSVFVIPAKAGIQDF